MILKEHGESVSEVLSGKYIYIYIHPALVLRSFVLHIFLLNPPPLPPFASLHFLIYALTFGLTPFIWLRSVTLNPCFLY